ncbi:MULTISPECIES: acyltransferase family protein [unclassified Microbacterium]|uniref:acyltransferase family protein n=1 Tax=unclassified Microbacterium TaxID=2609290 RepID=UPI0009DFE2F9|nr:MULTISPECIES: acyltransferase [unclassified Microbacterium]MEA1262399.1 acyltransferase [Microbacterium sp. STF-2]
MRNPELDSLRGLAAISVLLYHVLALNWATLQAGIDLLPADRTIFNILIFSPLHIIWLGAEAVWFFFVLSGFALTKAATRPGFTWSAYFPSRMLRLYGPVLFAILFAWLTYVLIPHVVEPGDNIVISSLPKNYEWSEIVYDATLLGGTSNGIGVLWSLQWEVVFSLLLPVYLYLVRRFPGWATLVAIVGCGIGWSVSNQLLSYMPMFFFGALLAQYWDQISRAFAFLRGGGWIAHSSGLVLVVVAICGMTSFFLVGRPLQSIGIDPRLATMPFALAGIVLLTILSVQWSPLSRLLSLRVMVFLGTISFSLYLVHRPIMIAMGFAIGVGAVPAILTVVASFAIAIGFYYAFERPIHRLARRLNRSIQRRESAGASAVSI